MKKTLLIIALAPLCALVAQPEAAPQAAIEAVTPGPGQPVVAAERTKLPGVILEVETPAAFRRLDRKAEAKRVRSVNFEGKLSDFVEACLNLDDNEYLEFDKELFAEPVIFSAEGTASQLLQAAAKKFQFVYQEKDGVASVVRPNPFRMYEKTYRIRRVDLAERAFKSRGSEVKISSVSSSGAESTAQPETYSSSFKGFYDELQKITTSPVDGFHRQASTVQDAERFRVTARPVKAYYHFNESSQEIVYVGTQQQHEKLEHLLGIYDKGRPVVRFRIDTLTIQTNGDSAVGINWDGILSGSISATDMNGGSASLNNWKFSLPANGSVAVSDLTAAWSLINKDSKNVQVTTVYKTGMAGEREAISDSTNKFIVLGSSVNNGGIATTSNQLSQISAGNRLEFVAVVLGDFTNPLVQCKGAFSRGRFVGTADNNGLQNTTNNETPFNVPLRKRSALCVADTVTEEAVESKGGIPVLRDIPYLEYVFGSRTTSKVFTRTVTFLSVEEVRDEFESEAGSRDAMRKELKTETNLVGNLSSDTRRNMDKHATHDAADANNAAALAANKNADEKPAREEAARKAAELAAKQDELVFGESAVPAGQSYVIEKTEIAEPGKPVATKLAVRAVEHDDTGRAIHGRVISEHIVPVGAVHCVSEAKDADGATRLKLSVVRFKTLDALSSEAPAAQFDLPPDAVVHVRRESSKEKGGKDTLTLVSPSRDGETKLGEVILGCTDTFSVARRPGKLMVFVGKSANPPSEADAEIEALLRAARKRKAEEAAASSKSDPTAPRPEIVHFEGE